MIPIRILLAHDHRVMRQALRALLEQVPEFTVVGEVADGLAAGDAVVRHEADVLVLGVPSHRNGCAEIARQVKRRRPGTKVLVLSSFGRETAASGAPRSAACGYVHRQSTAADLTAAIRAAMNEPGMVEHDAAHASGGTRAGGKHHSPDPFETLTPREREVLQLAAEGFGNVEIGRRLRISPRTVETHRANVMRKMGFHRLPDVIRYAVQRGILPHDGEASR